MKQLQLHKMQHVQCEKADNIDAYEIYIANDAGNTSFLHGFSARTTEREHGKH